MSRHFYLVLWMPLLFIVLFMAYWITITSNSYTELEEYILGKQVNYATDSAIGEMLEFSTTDVDYSDGEFILVEPELALTDFSYIMCWNMHLDPTESNRTYVQDNYIRTFAVCAYDGIYAYWNQKTATNDWHLVQTPKIPYFYTDDRTGIQYALTLNYEKGYQDNGRSDANYKMMRYNTYQNKPSNDLQNSAIDTQIENTLNWCLAQSYGQGKSDIKIEIPVIDVSYRTGAKAVESPTVMTIFQGRTTIYGTSPIAEVVGGSALEDAVHCVGYTYNGDIVNGVPLTGKFYATEKWFEKNPGATGSSSPVYFDSAYEAARAGYSDLSYIQ